MGSQLLSNRLKDRNYYYVWVGVFFCNENIYNTNPIFLCNKH